MRRTVSILAAVTLAVAACSSGDDAPAAEDPAAAEPAADEPVEEPAADEPAAGEPTDEPIETEPIETEPSDTNEPAPTDPDQPDTTEPPLETLPLDPITLAETALLTAADFPPGWTATPQEPDGDEDDELDARVDECIGLGPDAVTPTLDDLDAESPEFESSDGSFDVEHSVVVLPDEATALRAMAEIGDEDAPGCFVSVFDSFFAERMADPDQTDFPPGTELGEIVIEPLGVTPPPDITVAVRYLIPLSIGDDTLTLVIESWYVRQGRALARVQFRSVGQIFPFDGVEALMAIVVERLVPIS